MPELFEHLRTNAIVDGVCRVSLDTLVSGRRKRLHGSKTSVGAPKLKDRDGGLFLGEFILQRTAPLMSVPALVPGTESTHLRATG